MDLYGDLPPAQGESLTKTGERFGPALSASAEAQPKPKQVSKVPASLAFKPRQATQQPHVRPNPGPSIQKAQIKMPPVAMLSTTAMTSVENNSTSGETGRIKEVTSLSSNPKEEFNTNSSFDIEDSYDPSRPNDYIAYCTERLERRKQARVQEENLRRMEEADRAREALERERREAAQRGDYQSLLSSTSSMSSGGTGAGAGNGTGTADTGSSGAGRGRGRGRGLNNLPAWMTQQALATQSAEPAGQSSQAHTTDSAHTAGQFLDSTSSSSASTGEGTAGAVGIGIVGIKRKQGASKPSCVILLKNMVGAEEVDEQLAAETQQECLKYGTVEHCVVHTLPTEVDVQGEAEVVQGVQGVASSPTVRCPEEERVRTFVSFESQESAVRAFRYAA